MRAAGVAVHTIAIDERTHVSMVTTSDYYSLYMYHEGIIIASVHGTFKCTNGIRYIKRILW